MTNGDLIAAAETAGFDVLVTADKNLEYQQNIAMRCLAIVVLDDNRWSRVQQNVARIAASVERASAGHFIRVSFSYSASKDPGGPKLYALSAGKVCHAIRSASRAARAWTGPTALL